MDFRLKAVFRKTNPFNVEVSILVLMDFRLKVSAFSGDGSPNACFNPCSNGLSAQSLIEAHTAQQKLFVSILVLMDFRLKVRNSVTVKCVSLSFNPCSNGLSAQRTLPSAK